jgi:hypothetical protein
MKPVCVPESPQAPDGEVALSVNAAALAVRSNTTACYELDLGHISAVCDRLDASMPLADLCVTPRRRGYAVTGQTPVQARLVESEFARLGYRVTRPERIGRRTEVAITGWSARGLRSRIAALRDAVTDLRRSQEHTAAVAIARGPHTLAALHDDLRRAVERQAGVLTGHPPTREPADPDDARLLHAVRDLERDVDTWIGQHVDTAREAVRLAELYRDHLPEPQARRAAIREATELGELQAEAIPRPTAPVPRALPASPMIM